MPPGFTSAYTSKEEIAKVPLMAMKKRPHAAVETVSTKKLKKQIRNLKSGIKLNTHPLQKAIREQLEKDLEKAEKELAKENEEKTTGRLGKTEPGMSAFFGKRMGGKGTRRTRRA